MSKANIEQKSESGAVANPIRRYRVEGCRFCDEYASNPMMPSHDASSRCESGKRSHCTCDTCF